MNLVTESDDFDLAGIKSLFYQLIPDVLEKFETYQKGQGPFPSEQIQSMTSLFSVLKSLNLSKLNVDSEIEEMEFELIELKDLELPSFKKVDLEIDALINNMKTRHNEKATH